MMINGDYPRGIGYIAIEHGPCIVDLPIKNGDFHGYINLPECIIEHSQPWMGNLIMLNPLIKFAIDGENTTSNIHCQRLTTMKMNIFAGRPSIYIISGKSVINMVCRFAGISSMI